MIFSTPLLVEFLSAVKIEPCTRDSSTCSIHSHGRQKLHYRWVEEDREVAVLGPPKMMGFRLLH
jgi:hypothetical protein